MITAEAVNKAAIALNSSFDPVEVNAILSALSALVDFPTLSTLGTAGAAKRAQDPGNCTVAADGTSAGTVLNDLLAKLRLAGIIEGGAGGGE